MKQLNIPVKLPDYFTLLNALLGLFSIFFVLRSDYSTAAILLIIAVLADVLDGKIARAINREGDFGKELDSLADIISFGVAPIIFAYTLNNSLIGLIAYSLYLIAGLIRLARFNTTTNTGAFEGVPITTNGVLLPLIYFIGLSTTYYPAYFIVMAFLMVSSIKVKKIKW
ncbi:CDP-diacylglycerol--serine O-phosphatidyltransferase [Candidatus Woesearchaeota archaeon]|nr:CDP-diacylglycerol--serine O-phosphatidyltransferase [Candidatus Woesearchaeota archaeon]